MSKPLQALARRPSCSARCGLIATLLFLPTLLLAGCSECQPWDRLPIHDETDDGAPEALAAIDSALDDLQAWTGRSETCVDHVEVLDELSVDGKGVYLASSRTVRLQGDADAGAVVHEFCHAMDHEGDWLSEQGWDVLEPYADQVKETDGYPTEEARVHEAFARLCGSGPDLWAIVQQLDPLCEIGEAGEGIRYVGEVIYPEYPATALDLASRPALTRTVRPVAGSERASQPLDLSAVRGGDAAFVLDSGYSEGESEPFRPRILQLAPDDWSLEDQLALEAHGPQKAGGNPTVTIHALIGSSTSPILVQFAGDDAGSAWRVLQDPLRLEPLDWPDLGDGEAPTGFARDDLALVQASAGDPVVVIDLLDGTVSDLEVGDYVHEDSDLVGFIADQEGAVLVSTAASELTATHIDWSLHEVDRWELAQGTDRLQALARSGQGRVLLSPVFWGTLRDSTSYGVTLVLEPGSASWQVFQSACGAVDSGDWIPVPDGIARVYPIDVEGGGYALEVELIDL